MPLTLDPNIDAKVRASFGRQTMMATFGAQLTALRPGFAEISAPILPGALQQHGAAHAALTFAIGDSAAGYAALTQFDLDAEIMTAEMKINLLRPATGDQLIAEGRVIKLGRRLTIVQADVYAETDGTRRHIAVLQGTMVSV